MASLVVREARVSKVPNDDRWARRIVTHRERVPPGLFERRNARRVYAEALGKKLGFTNPDDWYRLRKRHLVDYGGGTLLSKYYAGSIHSLVSDLIPNPDGWRPWLFGRVPKGFWRSLRNRRRFVHWLAAELGIPSDEPQRWYEMSSDVLKRPVVQAMLTSSYRGSCRHVQMLREGYPKVSWQPFLFRNIQSSGFWDRSENRISFIKWYTESHLSYVGDWSTVTVSQIVQRIHKNPFLKHGMLKFLREAYPKKAWYEWTLRGMGIPDGFFKVKKNRLAYLAWLEKTKGFSQPEDWYSIQHADFQRYNGWNLLCSYDKCSVIEAACELHPSLKGREWLFDRVPSDFWGDKTNQLRYLEWAQAELGIKVWRDWYSVTQRDLRRLKKGSSLLHQYGGSIYSLCNTLWPQHDWVPWYFNAVGNRYWRDKNNAVQALRWLESELNIKEPTDWYKVGAKDFTSKNLGGLLANRFGNSPSRAAAERYPDYPWRGWLFEQVPTRFWHKRSNCRGFLIWLGQAVGVRKREDWYQLSLETFRQYGGDGMLQSQYRGNYVAAIMDLLPGTWDPTRFKKIGKGELLLRRIIHSDLKIRDVKYNYKHPELVFKGSGRSMELDFWFPAWNLAIEYQGEYHQRPRDRSAEARLIYERQLEKDVERREQCKAKGITLREIWFHQVKGNPVLARRAIEQALSPYVRGKSAR